MGRSSSRQAIRNGKKLPSCAKTYRHYLPPTLLPTSLLPVRARRPRSGDMTDRPEVPPNTLPRFSMSTQHIRLSAALCRQEAPIPWASLVAADRGLSSEVFERNSEQYPEPPQRHRLLGMVARAPLSGAVAPHTIS